MVGGLTKAIAERPVVKREYVIVQEQKEGDETCGCCCPPCCLNCLSHCCFSTCFCCPFWVVLVAIIICFAIIVPAIIFIKPVSVKPVSSPYSAFDNTRKPVSNPYSDLNYTGQPVSSHQTALDNFGNPVLKRLSAQESFERLADVKGAEIMHEMNKTSGQYRARRSIYGMLDFLGIGSTIRGYVDKAKTFFKTIALVVGVIAGVAVLFACVWFINVFLTTWKDCIQICFTCLRICGMCFSSCTGCYKYYCTTLAEGFGCGDCGEAFCSFECCDKRKDQKGKKKRNPHKYPREHMEKYGAAGRYIHPGHHQHHHHPDDHDHHHHLPPPYQPTAPPPPYQPTAPPPPYGVPIQEPIYPAPVPVPVYPVQRTRPAYPTHGPMYQGRQPPIQYNQHYP